MITIRLTRIGRKNHPAYRIAVANTRSKRDGKMIEYVGSYDTKTKPNTININAERIKYWLSQGAQMSPTVQHILVKEKVIKAPEKLKKFNNKPGKKKIARATKAKETKEETKEKPKTKEAETDKKSDIKPDTEIDTKTDTETDTKADTKVDIEPEEIKPDTKPDTEVDKETIKPDNKVDTKTDIKPNTKAE